MALYVNILVIESGLSEIRPQSAAIDSYMEKIFFLLGLIGKEFVFRQYNHHVFGWIGLLTP